MMTRTFRVVGRQDQLARGFRIFGAPDAGRLPAAAACPRRCGPSTAPGSAASRNWREGTHGCVHLFDPDDVGADRRQLHFHAVVAAVEVIDAVDQVSPRAARPAITSEAEARRSVAITGAPTRRSTPLMKAVLPSVRDARAEAVHLLHVHEAVFEDGLGHAAGPSAMQFTAMNWACMSVGKPGYSVVRKVTGLDGRPSARGSSRDRWSAPRRFAQLVERDVEDVGAGVGQRMSPPVAATAHRKVAASMRSEITACWRRAARPRPGSPGGRCRCRRSSRPSPPAGWPGRSLPARARRFPARSRLRPGSRPSAGSRCR
jgi:hypothetical protein